MVFKNLYCKIHVTPTYQLIFEWRHEMDNNQPNDEPDDSIVASDALLPVSATAQLSNRYQIAATSDNTRRAYQGSNYIFAPFPYLDKSGSRHPL